MSETTTTGSVSSMTGFGAGSAREGDEVVSVEVRSVNGKFCDVKLRLPRELASLEIETVKHVKSRLARGSVDVFVRREAAPDSTASTPTVNGPLLRAYAESLKAAAREAGLGDALEMRDLLELDGVVSLEERPPDLDGAQRALVRALDQALDALIVVRKREGEALEADFRGRSATLRRLMEEARELVPAQVNAWKERLEARLAELSDGIEIDPQRIAQEVVFFADRTDVAEEITRLEAHLDELERLLSRDQPVGRRLEFLLQEINRETNTLGSKSQHTDIARRVVEMKVELERMREQSLNVE